MTAFEKVKKMTIQLAASLIIHTLKENKKLVAIDLGTQQVFIADPKAIQSISFTENRPEYNNVLYYQRSQRNHPGLLRRNCGNIRNSFYEFHLVLV